MNYHIVIHKKLVLYEHIFYTAASCQEDIQVVIPTSKGTFLKRPGKRKRELKKLHVQWKEHDTLGNIPYGYTIIIIIIIIMIIIIITIIIFIIIINNLFTVGKELR